MAHSCALCQALLARDHSPSLGKIFGKEWLAALFKHPTITRGFGPQSRGRCGRPVSWARERGAGPEKAVSAAPKSTSQFSERVGTPATALVHLSQPLPARSSSFDRSPTLLRRATGHRSPPVSASSFPALFSRRHWSWTDLERGDVAEAYSFCLDTNRCAQVDHICEDTADQQGCLWPTPRSHLRGFSCVHKPVGGPTTG